MQPREKLYSLGLSNLTFLDLWVLVIGHGNKQKNVYALAEDLLDQFGGVQRLVSVPPMSLLAELPVGRATLARVLAVLELGRRYFTSGFPIQRPIVAEAKQAYQLLRDMVDYEQEAVRGLYLDARGHVIADKLLSLGTLSASILHPREVFRTALLEPAISVIIAHNHPSGAVEPSKSDIATTVELIAAANLLQIDFADHLIIGRNGYYSFREQQTDLWSDNGF